MAGKSDWYIIDGYRPPLNPGEVKYDGHEAIMILNCNDVDANCLIDVYYSDRDPVLGIPYTAPANRISVFRSDDESLLGAAKLTVNLQYSLRIRSDVGIIVQYGRADVSQPNLSYLATLGYNE